MPVKSSPGIKLDVFQVDQIARLCLSCNYLLLYPQGVLGRGHDMRTILLITMDCCEFNPQNKIKLEQLSVAFGQYDSTRMKASTKSSSG